MISYSELAELKSILDEELKSNQEDLNRLRSCQEGYFKLADSFAEEGCPDECLKLAVEILCSCCVTRVGMESVSGREIIAPVILDADKRNICVSMYDRYTEKLKSADRMYIPDSIERSMPDRDKLVFLNRQFMSKRSAQALQAQSAGKSFNRLFGSRG